MKKFVKNLILLFLILCVSGAIGILGLFLYFGKDLPSYEHLEHYDPPVITRIHAADGRLFAEYAAEKRVFLPIQSIPPHIIRTFLAVEDKNFYDHVGLDFISLVRATIHNIICFITKRGSIMGGSTITQQVAKNFLLTGEKSLTRKIREAILSLRLERAYSKDKILELYLNEIYLGAGTYGIGAASLYYFNKALDELTVAEAAYLACLPKAPNNYHPKRHAEAALERRNWVIARMLEEGIIKREEAVEAKKTPIIFKYRSMTETVNAQFFAEDVRRHLLATYGEETLYKGGLSVRTTLDSRLQNIAKRILDEGLLLYDKRHGWRGAIRNISTANWEKTLQEIKIPLPNDTWQVAVVLSLTKDTVSIGLKEGARGQITFESMKWARKALFTEKQHPMLGPLLQSPSDILGIGDVIFVEAIKKKEGFYTLEQLPEVNGALVAMDPHTGRVLAMVGGYSYERSQFNRATQANRQTGSAFKPFAYLAALENGYKPTSMLIDAPFSIKLPDGRLWQPQNIERRFFGSVTLRQALERSHNLALIHLAHQLGMQKIVRVVKRLDICDHFPPYLSAVLGTQETTLLRFTNAYAMILNGGKKITPILIDRIQDRRGKTIFKSDTRFCDECITQPWVNQAPPVLQDTRLQVADPYAAYQIVSLLEGAATRGTARRAQVPGHTIAAKTGTSNDYMDVWCMGFARDLVVGVFVGFDKPRSLGKGETGGTLAAPIFGAFMKEALQGTKDKPFRVPEGMKFMRTNRLEGTRATSSDNDVILEAFKPNEEPLHTAEDNPQGENLPSINISSSPQEKEGTPTPLMDVVY